MQISHSVAVPSHAEPANGPDLYISPILTGAADDAPLSPAGPANPLAELDSLAPWVGPPNQAAGKREARRANQQAEASGVPAAAPGQSAPAAFFTILGDIQDAQAGVAKTQADANSMLWQLAGAMVDASYRAPTPTAASSDAPTAADVNPGDSANPANQTVSQQPPARSMTSLLETDQAVVSQVKSESQPGATSPSEIAFTAWIAFKTADLRAMTPSAGQAAIAASRFEAAAAGAGPAKAPIAPAVAARNQMTPHTSQAAAESDAPAQTEQAIAVAPSPFEAMTAGDSWGESQGHAGQNASAARNSFQVQPATENQNPQTSAKASWTSQPAEQSTASPSVAAQPAASRTPSAPSDSAVMAVKAAAAGQAASSTAPGSHNASMVPVPPSDINQSSGRDSADSKPIPRDHAAQILEPQNEPAERAAEAVRDISLNVSAKDQNVQVRLSERGGELHVTVRTPDATLTHGLRDGLAELVGRLERGGYRADTWQPGGNDSRDRSQESPARRGSSQQQNAGGKGGGRQQNAKDDGDPQWVGALESSFQKE